MGFKFRVKSLYVILCLLVGTNIWFLYDRISLHLSTNPDRKISASERQYTNKGASQTTKQILVLARIRWMQEWIGERWETSDMFKNCPVSDCILSKKVPMNIADAVMFRGFELHNCWQKTKLGQVWIFIELEYPPYYKRSVSQACHRNMFNWTMNYRRDADFTLAHGSVQPSTSTGYNETALDEIIRSKTKTAVGFISHCNALAKREEIVEKLRSLGVDIDIYGKCGNLRCRGEPGTRWKPTWNITGQTQDDCFDVLDHRYKFFLSFENTLCVDYVTEKSLHLVLRHNIVPLARDGANHSLYHPKNSYIDTKDFKDVKSLAKRILYLSKNHEEYKEYFKWKKYYTGGGKMLKFVQQEFCNICKRLHNPEKYVRIYKDLQLFLNTLGNDKPVCEEPTDYLEE